MLRHLRLGLQFLKYSYLTELEYRSEFIIWALIQGGWFFFNLLFWQFLFGNLDEIGGWVKGQVFILQGFVFILESIIWGIFYGSLKHLPSHIHQGKLDLYLTKPVNTQFLLSFNRYNLDHLIDFIFGLILISYGLNLLSLNPSVVSIVISLVILLVSSLYFYAVYFITVCFAFFFDRLHNIVYLFPGIRNLSKIPRTAFYGFSAIAFTFIIPAAVITSLPSEALFTTPDYSLFLYLLIMAIICLYLSQLFFRFSLKHYTSASS